MNMAQNTLRQQWEARFASQTGEYPREQHQVHEFAQFVHQNDPAAWEQLRPLYLTECRTCGCWILPGGEQRHSWLHLGY